MKDKFYPMKAVDKENTYAGFQISAVAMIPFIIQSVVTAISSLKMLGTDNGSFQYNGMKSDWSQNKSSSTKAPKEIVRERYFSF